jgi:hypothetical protein
MSLGENKLDMQDFPIEMENMIMQELYNKAIEDQRRYENLVNSGEYLFIIEYDDEIAPDDKLVPYYINDVNMGKKKLSEINTIYDGFPINEIYRIPWKHPVLNMDKGDTFIHFYDQAQNIKEQRSSQPWAAASGNSGGSGMKNKKVKKCENKKVVLGKERCIYKVSGSKKDYMKYKGKLVPVADYIKSMKKKN